MPTDKTKFNILFLKIVSSFFHVYMLADIFLSNYLFVFDFISNSLAFSHYINMKKKKTSLFYHCPTV